MPTDYTAPAAPTDALRILHSIEYVINNGIPISGVTIDSTAVGNAIGAALAGTVATHADMTTLNAKVPALGQALAAASIPAVLPALQAAALAQESGGKLDTIAAAQSKKILAVNVVSVTTGTSTLAALLATAGGSLNASTKRIWLLPRSEVYWNVGGAAVVSNGPWIPASLTPLDAVGGASATDLRLIANGSAVNMMVIQEG